MNQGYILLCIRVHTYILFFIVLLNNDVLGQTISPEKVVFYYNRLTGVPPSQNEIDELIDKAPLDAALEISKSKNFVNVKLKNWLKLWSNRAGTNLAPINDFVTLILGVIRDDIDFRKVLTAEYQYIINYNQDQYQLPDYITGGWCGYDKSCHYTGEKEGHFSLAEDFLFDFSDVLTKVDQDKARPDDIGMPYIVTEQTSAGVMTTATFAINFYNMGTNRRATQYIFRNFLCKEFSDVADSNVSHTYIRRDVLRYPNGDVSTFLNECASCHAGQDALGKAFANYDFDMSIQYRDYVVERLNKVINYEDGHIVEDASWKNLWAGSEKNKGMDWDSSWRSDNLKTDDYSPSAHEGHGAKELGQYLANSGAFAECMSQRLFKYLCLSDTSYVHYYDVISTLKNYFQTENYNFRKLAAKTVTLCPTDIE